MIGYPTPNNSIGIESACDQFPTIELYGGDFFVTALAVQNITISGINFITANSTSLLSQSSLSLNISGSLSLENLCLSLQNLNESFLKLFSNAVSMSDLFVNNTSTFGYDLIELESINTIQIQNLAASNIDLDQTSFININYNNSVGNFNIEVDSVNFSDFNDTQSAIRIVGGSNTSEDSSINLRLLNSSFTSLALSYSALMIEPQIFSNVIVTNCSFEDNTSNNNGTAINCNGTLSIINCNFANNSANSNGNNSQSNGGAVIVYGNSTITN